MMPARLSRRPQFHGMPVPYFIQIDPRGVPDFRVIDPGRMRAINTRRLCGLCGERLGRRMVFVGGPISLTESHAFTDPPMHEDCARYAFTVCPFLMNEGASHAAIDAVAARHQDQIQGNPAVVQGRPVRMGMLFTFDYRLAGSRGTIYVVDTPIRVEWMDDDALGVE